MLRDRAREAAVGAKSPVDGVFERVEVGVLAREASEREAFFGVTGAGFTVDFLVDVVDTTD